MMSRSSLVFVCGLVACAGSEPAPPASPPPPAPAAPASAAPAPPAAAPSAAPLVASAAPPAPPPPALPRGTTVLHVGDSFADALGIALRDELALAGIKTIHKAKTGSYIPDWAGVRSDVPRLIHAHKPDLVIITLGGNELKVPDPSVRAEAIRKLVSMVGDRPCVWVAPSLWKVKDGLVTTTGLLGVIREHSKPCRYFDTNAVVPDLERTSDHIHPSIPARKIWAQAFTAWLAREREPNGARPWQMKRAPD